MGSLKKLLKESLYLNIYNKNKEIPGMLSESHSRKVFNKSLKDPCSNFSKNPGGISRIFEAISREKF